MAARWPAPATFGNADGFAYVTIASSGQLGDLATQQTGAYAAAIFVAGMRLGMWVGGYPYQGWEN